MHWEIIEVSGSDLFRDLSERDTNLPVIPIQQR